MSVVRLVSLLFASMLLGADCGQSPCPGLAAPMTPARAKEIDPAVDTGLAASTTLVYGDCRPMELEMQAMATCGAEGRCARERRPLSVFVVPVNTSIVVSPDCAPELGVADLTTVAAFEGTASDAGELVASLEPGRYTVYVSSDDRCAVCGLAQDAGACIVKITGGQITARDLVLDRSSH